MVSAAVATFRFGRGYARVVSLIAAVILPTKSAYALEGFTLKPIRNNSATKQSRKPGTIASSYSHRSVFHCDSFAKYAVAFFSISRSSSACLSSLRSRLTLS
jgi:hypothetical protein